jgi:UDP-glucose 4-epimerase
LKFFITGGSGFIGHNIVNHLQSVGHDVIAFDNLSRHKDDIKLNPTIDFIQGDICDLESLKKVMKSVNCVIHLAAINGTENFYSQPQNVLKVGIEGTLNVIKSSEINNVETLIFASSAEVYGSPQEIPTDEDVSLIVSDVKEKRFSYSGSKIAGELMMIHIASQSIPRPIIFRPHNIYGPSMGHEHVIPQLISKVKKANVSNGSVSIDIQGSGNESRAFTYVSDLVKALDILIDSGKANEIYNIGNPKETTILELVSKIGTNLGIQIKTHPSEIVNGSPNRRCPDITKIKKLGFEPNVDLDEGLSLTIPHYWEVKD